MASFFHSKLYACFWAYAHWLQWQDREGTQKGWAFSSALCQKKQAAKMKDPAVHFWGLLGLRGSKSPMLLCSLKMQSLFGTREVPVKRASSRKWVIFILLMSYFPRQAWFPCLRESQLPEDKPPSHHFLTWVTYLNNITHSLVYFLFLKKLFFFNAVNPMPSITIESVNSLQIFSHFPPKAL